MAGIVCIGVLAFNSLNHTVTTHANTVYRQQMTLAKRYETNIDTYNKRLARDKTENMVAKVKPSVPLEVAGTGRNHLATFKDGTSVYMIKSGDTLTRISATLGYSVDELAEFNHIRNVNLIYANSALRVPKGH